MLWKILLSRNIFQKPIDEIPAPLALLKLFADHAEAPFPPLIVGDGVIQLVPAKIRPEAVADVDLRIGKLPEEKIADPELSARSDQQVGIGDIGGRKVPGDKRFIDLPRGDFPREYFRGNAANGAREIPSAAVAER